MKGGAGKIREEAEAIQLMNSPNHVCISEFRVPTSSLVPHEWGPAAWLGRYEPGSLVWPGLPSPLLS